MAEKKTQFTSAPGPTELAAAGLGGVGLTGTAAEIAAAKAAAAKEKSAKEAVAKRKKAEEQAKERLAAAEKRYQQLQADLKNRQERRQTLIKAIAEGTTDVIEGQYRSQIAGFDKEISTLQAQVDSAKSALDTLKNKGFKGTGTKASPLTQDGKPFTGDYRGTKYKNGIKVEAEKPTDKYTGSGTAKDPLNLNGKPFTGTYQGRKYTNGVVSTQTSQGDQGKGDQGKGDTGKGDAGKGDQGKGDTGKKSFAEILAEAEDKYGELDSIFEQDEELKTLLRTAIEGGYEEERFLSEIQRTEWWKSNAGPIRQRDFYRRQYEELEKKIKTTDPDYQKKIAELNQRSEYGRGLQLVIDSLKEEETRQGKTLDDATRLQIAKNIYNLANEGNPLAYRNAVTSSGKFGEVVTGGESATQLQNLRRIAKLNGFDFDTKYANQKETWLNAILQGENPEKFYALIRNDAAQNQGAYVKELLQNGYNLEEIYSNYIQLMAQAFNIDPNTIDIKDPLLQKVFTDKGGLKFNEFDALLRNDPRYQGTPGAFADKDFRQSIIDLAVAEGVTLTDAQIDDIVNSALALGAAANSATVSKLIRAKLTYTPGQLTSGRAGNVLAELKATAAANGLDLDTSFGSSIQGWLQNVAQGESIETYKRIIRQTAKLGLPERVGQLLDQGVDLETIYSPYKNTMAAILEINPQTITLNDPTLRSAINQEGEMSLYEYQRALRKDSRWQYTNNAREDVSTSVMGVLRDFGFQG